jgi:hypothetical protein
MPKAVTPRPSTIDYVYENLGLTETDSDQGGDCCARFAAGADMAEGVSGRKKIDTTYENFSEDLVDAPRSDSSDGSATASKPAPYPMGLYRYPHRRY